MIINNKKKYPLRDRKKKGFFFATSPQNNLVYLFTEWIAKNMRKGEKMRKIKMTTRKKTEDIILRQKLKTLFYENNSKEKFCPLHRD